MSAVASTTVEMRPGGLWLAFAHNKLAWVGLVLLALIVCVAVRTSSGPRPARS